MPLHKTAHKFHKKKIKLNNPYNLAIPLQGIYPHEYENGSHLSK